MAKSHSVILVEATGFEPTTSWSRTSSLHAKAVSFACAKRYRTAATPLPKKSHCVIFFGSPEITLARLASGPNKKGRQKPSSFGRGDGIRALSGHARKTAGVRCFVVGRARRPAQAALACLPTNPVVPL